VLDYKRIVITGGYGFIGSYFVELMIQAGKEVYIIDKLTYATQHNYVDENNHFLSNHPKRNDIKLQCVDIADKYLHRVLDQIQPDVIVNFAAESHVDRSLSDDDVFMSSNVLGVKNILEYMRLHPKRIKTMVQVSTDEVGGDWISGSFKEIDKRNSRNPYSASKAMAEILCEAYSHNFKPHIFAREYPIFVSSNSPLNKSSSISLSDLIGYMQDEPRFKNLFTFILIALSIRLFCICKLVKRKLYGSSILAFIPPTLAQTLNI